jgi:hypothetical protein
MRRRSSAQLFTAVVLAATLSACSEDDSSGNDPWSAGAPASSEAPAAPAAAPTPDLRAAELVADLEPTAGARARAFPAGDVAEVLTSEGEAGSLQDLGCFAAADGNGPNAATPVDCAQPHLGETYASVPMDDSWPADYAAYTEGGAARERWLAWADAQCANMISQAVAGDGAINRALGVDAALHPSWDGLYGFTLPRDQWEAGTHVTHCWVVATGDAPPSGRWVSTLLSAARPNEVSFCDAGGGNSTMIEVRCDQPHWREWTFSTDALPALGQEFVNSVDPNNPTDEQYLVLDQF